MLESLPVMHQFPSKDVFFLHQNREMGPVFLRVGAGQLHGLQVLDLGGQKAPTLAGLKGLTLNGKGAPSPPHIFLESTERGLQEHKIGGKPAICWSRIAPRRPRSPRLRFFERLMEISDSLPKGLLKRVQHDDTMRGKPTCARSETSSGTTRSEPQRSSVPGAGGSSRFQGLRQ
jgi:hypothetical protein